MKRLPFISPFLLACVFVALPQTGCSKKDRASVTQAPSAGPPAPQYESAFAEAQDLPKQMVAQVEWAKQPITEAMALADEITALKGKANLDPGQFKGLLTAAFKDGKVAVDAELGLDAETQAELEATLKKLKEIGPKLKEVPKRAKTAVGNVLKLAAKAPFLVGKAGRELKKQLKEAAADNKTEVQANITSLKDLPGQAKNQMGEIKTQLTSLPQEATRALTKLTASFAGNVSAS